MSGLLFAVYAYSQEDSNFNSIWIKNEFMEVITDMLDKQLDLCIYSFIKLNGDAANLSSEATNLGRDDDNWYAESKHNLLITAGTFAAQVEALDARMTSV